MNASGALSDLYREVWLLVADHVWQATVFAGLVFVATLVLGRGPARARYALWLLAAIKFAVPSFVLAALVSVVGLGVGLQPTEPVAAPSSTSTTSTTVATEARIAMEPTSASSVAGEMAGVWTAVWLAGVLGAAAIFWLRHRRLDRTLRAGRVLASGREAEALARAVAAAGVSRAVALVCSPLVFEPGVFGALHPTVVLPEGMAERLGDEDLDMIFLHEMAHVRRRDNAVGFLLSLLCAVFWYWPVVWIVRRQLMAERERACDDWVIERCERPSVYVSSLLKVCRLALGPSVGTGMATFGGSDLGARVEAIVTCVGRKRSALRIRPVVAGGVAAFVAFSLVGMARSASGLSRTAATVRACADQIAPPAHTPHGRGVEESEADGATLERATPFAVPFENAPDAPIEIASASLKAVPLGQAERGIELVGPPIVELVNRTDRVVVGVRLSLKLGKNAVDASDAVVHIDPHGSVVLQIDWRQWTNRVPEGTSRSAVVRCLGATFGDGTTWGQIADRAPVAQDALLKSSGDAGIGVGGYIPASYTNTSGAPLRITRAGTTGGNAEVRSFVELQNVTNARIVGVKLRFKADAPSHAVTAQRVDVAPNGTLVIMTGVSVAGRPEDLRVQLLGVELDDGRIWGAFDTSINSREETVAVPEYLHEP